VSSISSLGYRDPAHKDTTRFQAFDRMEAGRGNRPENALAESVWKRLMQLDIGRPW
jgi:hypothetical protein